MAIAPINSRFFTLSQSVFRRLLQAYPLAYRTEYGEAMEQVFRDQCRDAWNEAHGWGLAKLWLRVLPDVMSTSIVERLSTFNPRKNMSNRFASLFRFGQASAAATFFTVFITVFLLVVFIGTAITFILPESYASTARIRIERGTPEYVGLADLNGLAADISNGLSQPNYDPYFMQTTFEIIKSDAVLNNVVSNQNLNVRWGKKYYGGKSLATSESLDILRRRLYLTPVRNTKLVSLTVYSDDKNEAANLANAIAQSYIDYRASQIQEQMKQALLVLQKQYDLEDQEISADQSNLNSLQKKSNSTNNDTNTMANQRPADQTYLSEQTKLNRLRDLHKLLSEKIQTLKIDLAISRSPEVAIIDYAQPGRAPVKPNKVLNIAISIIAGIFLGTGAGITAVLAQLMIGKRRRIVSKAL